MNACRLLTRNDKVMDYKAALRQEDERKVNITRTMQNKKLDRAYDIAAANNQASAMVSAVREQNEMAGLHREKALNPEKEAERAASMTAEEHRLAEITARVRMEEEARKGVVRLRKAQ